jgi:hypothetical protein
MMEMRDMTADDIMAIKDNLVESRNLCITKEIAKKMSSIGVSFTCVDNDKVIACCGGVKEGNTWSTWAIYSNEACCFARARSAIMFRKKFHEWKKEHPGDRVLFRIPSDLPNGKRYGDFFGAVSKGVEQSKLFLGVDNNIYEVT